MNIWKSEVKKLMWIIPAIVAFFIALIPTLKYQWPLGWDIIYHVQYAQIYAKYGLVLTNPLLNAPFGQKIGYPPLFHLILAGLVSIFRSDYFQVARFLQPLLAMLTVLSVSYVSNKFYGKIAGLSTGFLVLSSFLVSRIILPVPENLALIFLPLAVYFYYRSLKEKILKYAFIAGLMFLVIIFTHLAAALCLFLIITSVSLVEMIYYRDLGVFKNYGAFIIFLVSLALMGMLALIIWSPETFKLFIQDGITAATGFNTSISTNRPMSLLGYLGFMGYLVLTFALVGGLIALNKRRKKDLYIITWTVIMFLLSNAYWFGINVISYRVLIYILIPLSILGGFGVSQVCLRLKEQPKFSSKKFRTAFILSIFVLATFTSILTVENPKIATFSVKNEFGNFQIAPPTSSEVDLARWFNSNGDKNKSILTNNLFTGTFIATVSGIPLHYGFEDLNRNISQSAFNEARIGYVVVDKRLTFPSNNQTFYLQKVDSEFYPLIYFSKDVPSNINEIIPHFMRLVYENQDYIIFKIV